MRQMIIGLGCAALLGTASTSWATLGVVFSDDFESYGSTSAMTSVWSGPDGVLVNYAGAGAGNFTDDNVDSVKDPEVTLQADNGASAFHPGGSVNVHDLGTTLMPTTDEWIQLTVDIYDNDTSLDPLFPLKVSSKRMGLGLRAAGANIVELGMWNDPFRFAYRGILFESLNDTPNPNWQVWDMGEEDVNGSLLPVNRFRGAQWYTYRATIKPESVLYEFDLDYDGTFDFAAEHFDMPPTPAGFTELRFGGPSNVSSEGGGVTFDNVLLEVVAATVPGIPGDLNGDGYVGLDDLQPILDHWNQNVTVGDAAMGDISGPLGDPDGYVGLDDLQPVLDHWNEGTPPTPAAIPEPASLALISIGGFALLRRR